MDDVERMYRHLVRTIRTSYPQHLSQPFQVGELYQTILPYRLHRRDLGLETNQDYELALLELLGGDRGYLVVDGKMRDALKAELSATTPDTTRIREFAAEHIALAPEAIHLGESGSMRSVSGGGQTVSRAAVSPALRSSAPGSGKAVPTPTRTSEASSSPSPIENARRAARPLRVAETGETCAFCRGDLPAGREISFCPHCGQDLTIVHCPACGSELERGWKFCVTCGRGAASADSSS